MSRKNVTYDIDLTYLRKLLVLADKFTGVCVDYGDLAFHDDTYRQHAQAYRWIAVL